MDALFVLADKLTEGNCAGGFPCLVVLLQEVVMAHLDIAQVLLAAVLNY